MRVEYKKPDELPCIACGYNLRFAKLPDRCPECGTVINKSRAWPLRGPADTGRFVQGMALMAMLNCILVGVAVTILWQIHEDKKAWFLKAPVDNILYGSAIYSVLLAGACWRATALPLTGTARRARMWFRGSCAMFIAAPVIPLIILLLREAPSDEVVGIGLFLLPIIWGVHYFGGVYCEEICWACEMPRLGRAFYITGIVLPIAAAGWEISGVIKYNLEDPQAAGVAVAIFYALTVGAFLLWIALQWCMVIGIGRWLRRPCFD